MHEIITDGYDLSMLPIEKIPTINDRQALNSGDSLNSEHNLASISSRLEATNLDEPDKDYIYKLCKEIDIGVSTLRGKLIDGDPELLEKDEDRGTDILILYKLLITNDRLKLGRVSNGARFGTINGSDRG